MSDELLAWGEPLYWVFAGILLFARGMDFLSTYVATPNMVLEGNPLARRMGWKIGAAVNLILCFGLARWPLTAIIIATASILVAARNFHSAWLMRSMGEEMYRRWFVDRICETPPRLYLGCLAGQTLLTGLIGAPLLWFDGVPMAVGMGIISYSVIVLFYTLLSLWRLRRNVK